MVKKCGVIFMENISGLMDLHNHTVASDGKNTAAKIIENAISHGISCVGITDHFNTTKCNSISIRQLENYINNLNYFKEKYKDNIKVLSGIEICTLPGFSCLGELPCENLNRLDYVLLEYLDTSGGMDLMDIGEYTAGLSCRIGLAHTDLFKLFRMYGEDIVYDTLRKLNIFWELNISYSYCDCILKAPSQREVQDLIQNLKKNNIWVSVGTDTHNLLWYDTGRLTAANKFAAMINEHKCR